MLESYTNGFSPPVDGKFHCDVDYAIRGLLTSRLGNLSVEALHGRNDCILELIRLGANDPSLSLIRDSAACPSTVAGTRPDAYLATPGYPALVIVEERRSFIDNAIKDLKDKFVSDLPHYHPSLEWIVGIATGDDAVRFGTLSLTSPRQTPAPFAYMDKFNLNTQKGLVGCARAAINVGRWVSWVRSSGYVFSIETTI
jgi:hypothetical protein